MAVGSTKAGVGMRRLDAVMPPGNTAVFAMGTCVWGIACRCTLSLTVSVAVCIFFFFKQKAAYEILL